jgi:hypothetical protein
MYRNARFQTTYIALVALAWDALERIDQRLILHDDAAAVTELPLLRLELLQLGEKSRCCAGSRLVSASQNALVQRLVTNLLAWLDFDAGATTEIAQIRIRSAQNWLFDEARQGQWIAPRECDVRQGKPALG